VQQQMKLVIEFAEFEEIKSLLRSELADSASGIEIGEDERGYGYIKLLHKNIVKEKG